MKRNLLFSGMALMAGSLMAADSSPKDEITTAAKKLGDQPNYSWTATTKVPEGTPFRPGPMQGKTEKGGYTVVTTRFGENERQTVLKHTNAAFMNRDGEWQTLADVEGEGRGQFIAAMVRSIKPPAQQVADLAADTKDLKKDGDVYSSDLTEEGAKKLLRFGRRGGDNEGPTISNAKASVKFWLKEGALTKYEVKVQGTVSFNGNDMDVDRTTTTEIKDVCTTKVEVPAEAKKKLEAK